MMPQKCACGVRLDLVARRDHRECLESHPPRRVPPRAKQGPLRPFHRLTRAERELILAAEAVTRSLLLTPPYSRVGAGR